MCKKIKKILIISTIFVFLIIPRLVNAQNYSLNDLIENGKKTDGKFITVTGEAIGETLERGNYAWININDTSNAMGVYMTLEDSHQVSRFGSSNEKGDELQVEGTFNRACSEHGGDMDIHAKQVNVIKKGEIKKQIVSINKIVAAGSLTLITIVCGYVFYRVINKKS
ncbi:MAG: hypothetical protein RSG52_09660 [Terrisporobacter sp.]|uniref:hypothetical protein n=1 Tax=Terrisporobacter sp. TaxID=1965305 RepID=UPI002FC81822